jgi:hypothetical protein
MLAESRVNVGDADVSQIDDAAYQVRTYQLAQELLEFVVLWTLVPAREALIDRGALYISLGGVPFLADGVGYALPLLRIHARLLELTYSR